MNIWLDIPEVRTALNIQQDNSFNSGDNGGGLNYTSTELNVLPFYEYVRAKTDLRVLVYNGDADPAINSFVTQEKYVGYYDSLGVEASEEWRPWTLDGDQRMGGYVISYPGDFYYLTVRGSGHMVPEYKPAATYAFIEAFLNNDEFPRYVAPKNRKKRTRWWGKASHKRRWGKSSHTA